MHGSTVRRRVGLEVSQWKYLSTEAREHEMHAVLTVRVDGTGTGHDGPGPEPVLAEVLVIDGSSSMTWPQEKFHAARQAAVAAVRMLPDGTPFAVVRGTETAGTVYPDRDPVHVGGAPAMVRADATTRAAAERAVLRLDAGGGTCIGAWLDLSRRLLMAQDAPIGHVLLLTDGKNQHDDEMPLSGVLDACEGRFVCDAWGIGDGWDARELLRIARRLHGSVGSVREESALPAKYERLLGRLLTKSVPELVIRVEPTSGTAVRYLKQVFPTEVELAPVAESGADRAFVTRAWGDEIRRYHLCLTADPADRPRGEDLQLAVVSVSVGGPHGTPTAGGVRLPPPRPCVVHWTDDPALSRRTDGQVRHFELYGELGKAVAAAADAYRRGDGGAAEEQLGRAVRLAHTVGAARQLADFERLVEVLDATAGRVRLRQDLAAVDFEHLIAASSHSTYGPGPVTGPDDSSPGTATGTTPCPSCGAQAPATARFCPRCGHPLAEGRPAEGRRAEGRPTADRPAESRGTEKPPAQSRPAEARTAEARAAEGRPAEGRAAEARPAEGPSEGQS